MSNNKQKAYENLQRLALMVKDIIAVAPELQAIGSMEQAVEEAKQKLESSRSALQAQRDAHDRALAEASQKAERAAEKIKSDADEYAKKVKLAADEVMKNANERASGIVLDAHAAAAKAAREAAGKLEATQRAHKAMEASLAAKTAEHNDLIALLDDKQHALAAATEQHDRIQSAIAEARRRLGME